MTAIPKLNAIALHGRLGEPPLPFGGIVIPHAQALPGRVMGYGSPHRGCVPRQSLGTRLSTKTNILLRFALLHRNLSCLLSAPSTRYSGLISVPPSAVPP